MIEKTVWQDEKYFTLDIPVNLQNDREYGKRKKNLMFQMRLCLRLRIRCQESYGFRCNLLVRRHETVFCE